MVGSSVCAAADAGSAVGSNVSSCSNSGRLEGKPLTGLAIGRCREANPGEVRQVRRGRVAIHHLQDEEMQRGIRVKLPPAPPVADLPADALDVGSDQKPRQVFSGEVRRYRQRVRPRAKKSRAACLPRRAARLVSLQVEMLDFLPLYRARFLAM